MNSSLLFYAKQNNIIFNLSMLKSSLCFSISLKFIPFFFLGSSGCTICTQRYGCYFLFKLVLRI